MMRCVLDQMVGFIRVHSEIGSAQFGSIGPLLLQDYHLTEIFGSFDRERIPERVVHARGGMSYTSDAVPLLK